MRIARYTLGEDPTYGIVQGDPGKEWLAEVPGDPLYQPILFTGHRVLLADARLLAPLVPPTKVTATRKTPP